MSMNDVQLEALKHTTWNSIGLIGDWLNSAALWELIGIYMGLLIVASLLTAVLTRPMSMMGFRSRD